MEEVVFMPKRSNFKKTKNGGKSKSRATPKGTNKGGVIVQQQSGGGGWGFSSASKALLGGAATLVGIFGSAGATGGFGRNYCDDIFNSEHDSTNIKEVMKLIGKCAARMQEAYNAANSSGESGSANTTGSASEGADSVIPDSFFNPAFVWTTIAGVSTALGVAAFVYFFAGRCKDNEQSESNEKEKSGKRDNSLESSGSGGPGGDGKKPSVMGALKNGKGGGDKNNIKSPDKLKVKTR